MQHYLVLNFKTYPESSGPKALELAKVATEVGNRHNVNIVICPQAVDIYRIRTEYPLVSIWAQHIDPVTPGRNTGWTSPAATVMAGANGALINHSEHQLSQQQIEDTVKTCKQYQLTSCVAVNDGQTAQQVKQLNPDFIAFEPEELISGEKSLVDIDPDRAKSFLSELNIQGGKVLLGAGVRQASDIKAALAYGYVGALLASGFVKSANPASFLEDILSGFN